jgi:hypothetical protein
MRLDTSVLTIIKYSAMQLGMHFALSDEQAARLLAARGDNDALQAIIDELEEGGARARRSTDKAWEPISCALAPSGSERDPDDWPWTGVIVGAEELQAAESDMMVGYTPPDKVAEVAEALEDLRKEGDFPDAYEAMPEELRNPEYGGEECEYAQANLDDLTDFFVEAAALRAHVIFHVNG